MAPTYDALTYLLDKEHIRDTILRMMFGYDDRASSTLINSVYTPEITLDYDPLLLPDFQKKISSEQWAKRLENMHDHYDTTQHIVQNLLIELPQSTTQRPDSCKARAYAHGWFYKRDAEGRPTVMARRNGAGYDLELVRLEGKDSKEENPWRISMLKVTLDWQDKGV